jgi:excisionase family DNA binding protein
MLSPRDPEGVQRFTDTRFAVSIKLASSGDAEADVPTWACARTEPEQCSEKARSGQRNSNADDAGRDRSSIGHSSKSNSNSNFSSSSNSQQSGNRRRQAPRSATLQPLLTVTEFAAVLNVSERTVRRLAASGSLQTVRIGRVVRFRAEEVGRIITMGEGL